LDQRVFKQGVEQGRHMADIVYADTEPPLAGKKGLHILDAEG